MQTSNKRRRFEVNKKGTDVEQNKLIMESQLDVFTSTIRLKQLELVKQKKQDINDELSRIRQSSQKRFENRQQELQGLHCSFPSSLPSVKLAPREKKEFLEIVDDKKAIQKLQFKVLKYVEPYPPMKAYLPLQRNIMVEGESIMSSIPYIGEKEADSEFVNDLLRNHNECKPKQSDDNTLAWFDEMIFMELVEFAKECDDGGEEIDIYEALQVVLQANLSRKELRIKYENLKKFERKTPHVLSIDSENATKNEYEQTVKSFQSKFCRRCFIYGCFLHKDEPSVPEKNPHQLFDTFNSTLQPCFDSCYKKKNNVKAGESKHDEVWTGSDISLYRVLSQMFTNNYCAIAKALQTKSCSQVHAFALTAVGAVRSTDNLSVADEKVPAKKSQKSKATNAFKLFVKVGHKKNGEDISTYIPCNHKGKCNANDCQCFQNGKICEKFCQCSITDCGNRFEGCQCKAKCDKSMCACKLMLHECDPDVCKCQISTTDEGNVCKNSSIQRGLKKHLLLGKSDVAGWGIFTKDAIGKDEFISEYCGEIISDAETEQRAIVYDRLGSNYIFKLTNEFSIDATRKGNKIRFCNHSTKPNCYGKTIFVNGDYRIAFYAKRRIEANEELFINYGDSYLIHFKKEPK